MKKFLFAIFFLMLFISCNAQKNIRKMAVAGGWYPSDKGELKNMLEGFLSYGEKKAKEIKNLKIDAIIVPHAGYVYSGKAAGSGYAAVRGKNYKRIIIIAPSHYYGYHGISVGNFDEYETPFGNLRVDRKSVSILLKNNLFFFKKEAHIREHSIEIQLPFIKYLFPDAKIVPMLVGFLNLSDYKIAVKKLKKIVDSHTLIVVSSDFTHYGRVYNYTPFKEKVLEKIKERNKTVAKIIENVDFIDFLGYLENTHDTICGRFAIAILLKYLSQYKRGDRGKLIDFYTSADVVGFNGTSVSYLTFIFSKGVKKMNKGSDKLLFHLNEEEQNFLLKLARETLEKYLSTGSYPKIDETKLTDNLKTPCGVFVTLTKHGQLRGCIGYIVGVKPLYEGVMENAVNAALHDPRFNQVRYEELKDIKIEISVLSPLKECENLNTIKVGRDGLYVQMGGRSGLLLPQVATEWGWNREQFLEAVCHKAGLPGDCYKMGAKIFTFTAQVFHEK